MSRSGLLGKCLTLGAGIANPAGDVNGSVDTGRMDIGQQRFPDDRSNSEPLV